jgi:hypothetical protein
VVTDLRDQLAVDGLEHRSAVPKESPVRAPDDAPQAEPVVGVAPASSLDPGGDPIAVERCRVVAHRNRIAQDLEEGVDVIEVELPQE